MLRDRFSIDFMEKSTSVEPGVTPVKEKWHHKKWVRIMAGCLAAVMLITEIILHFSPETPEVLPQVLDDPQVLVEPDIQEFLGNPEALTMALRQAKKERADLMETAELAEEYIAAGEYEKAIEPVDELIEKMGLSGESLLQMEMTRTALCFSCGRFEEAAEGCTELIDQGRDEAGYYYFMRSVCSLQAEDYQSSRDDLLMALERGYEDQSLCYVHLAFCEYYLENYSKVLEYAGQARGLGVQEIYEPTLMYLQAIASLKQEQFEDSITYIDGLLATEAYAEDRELYYYRGVSCLAMEEYQDAYDDFNRAMECGEETTMLFYNRGVAALGLNMLEEAQADLEKVVEAGDQPELTQAAQEVLKLLTQEELEQQEDQEA